MKLKQQLPFALFAAAAFLLADLAVCNLNRAEAATTATGQLQRPAAKPTFVNRGRTGSGVPRYSVIYQFGTAQGQPYEPLDTLTLLNGALYGVFFGGGAGSGGIYYGGVYKVTPPGTVSFIHYFTGSATESGNPSTSLLAVNGNLYGTMTVQSASTCCILYEITPSGEDRLLQKADSRYQLPSSLTEFNGALYGTLESGPGPFGSIFERSASGARIVYVFPGGSRGASPNVLTAANNTLYGTTTIGGDANCKCGVVYRLDSAGITILHTFTGSPSDGAEPGRLLYNNGIFYGTSYNGGAYNLGAVFAVDLFGHERIIYSFKGGADGANPTGDLVDVGGVLYGMTNYGGLACNGPYLSCGTIFSVSPSGTETVVQRFNGTNGLYPSGGLTYLNGVFFGSATAGGSSFVPGINSGLGVVFSLTL